MLQGVVNQVFAAVLVAQPHDFVFAVEVVDVLAVHREEVVANFDHEARLVRFLSDLLGHLLHQQAHEFSIGGELGVGFSSEQSPFFKGFLQIGSFKWFEQVIDAIDLEGTEGVFVVSRGENYRTRDVALFKNGKTQSIGQLDVKKREIGLGVVVEPGYRSTYRIQYGHNFHLCFQALQGQGQTFGGQFFIFYNDHFHDGTRGILTVKKPPSCEVCTALMLKNL